MASSWLRRWNRRTAAKLAALASSVVLIGNSHDNPVQARLVQAGLVLRAQEPARPLSAAFQFEIPSLPKKEQLILGALDKDKEGALGDAEDKSDKPDKAAVRECIIVVGTTGTGKSSTISKYTGRDVPVSSGAESQTRKCQIYTNLRSRSGNVDLTQELHISMYWVNEESFKNRWS